MYEAESCMCPPRERMEGRACLDHREYLELWSGTTSYFSNDLLQIRPNLHDSCYVVSYDCVVCACRAFLGTQVSKAPRETKGLRGSRAREDGPDQDQEKWGRE